MCELIDVKVKVRRVEVQDGMGFGVETVLEGVNLQGLINAINGSLHAKGSKIRVEMGNPDL